MSADIWHEAKSNFSIYLDSLVKNIDGLNHLRTLCNLIEKFSTEIVDTIRDNNEKELEIIKKKDPYNFYRNLFAIILTNNIYFTKFNIQPVNFNTIRTVSTYLSKELECLLCDDYKEKVLLLEFMSFCFENWIFCANDISVRPDVNQAIGNNAINQENIGKMLFYEILSDEQILKVVCNVLDSCLSGAGAFIEPSGKFESCVTNHLINGIFSPMNMKNTTFINANCMLYKILLAETSGFSLNFPNLLKNICDQLSYAFNQTLQNFNLNPAIALELITKLSLTFKLLAKNIKKRFGKFDANKLDLISNLNFQRYIEELVKFKLNQNSNLYIFPYEGYIEIVQKNEVNNIDLYNKYNDTKYSMLELFNFNIEVYNSFTLEYK